SNSATFSWVVDTVPPPAPTIDAHPANPSATAAASFAFSDSEAGVVLRCSLDGVESVCGSPMAYSGLADGSHTFAVRATDAAGQSSGTVTFAWSIHPVVPPAPHIDSAPPALSNLHVSTIAFSDVQSGLAFSCTIDTSAATPCVSPVTFIGLPDGRHTFGVVAV